MTQHADKTKVIEYLPSACKALSIIAVGFMTTTVQASDNLQLNSGDNITEKTLGVRQINYLKIPGYASGAGLYARSPVAVNTSNATGNLTIRGLPAVGNELAAALTGFTDTVNNENDFTDETGGGTDGNEPDGLPDDIVYHWYRSPGTCDANEKRAFIPLRDVATQTPVGTPVGLWCQIKKINSMDPYTGTDYILRTEDAHQYITATITYINQSGATEVYSSTVNKGGICPVEVNFDNAPNLGCFVPLFWDSFEN